MYFVDVGVMDIDLHSFFFFLYAYTLLAWWNIELGAFVLNFGGRVKVASVKNFQLCEQDVQDHIMQFGRIGSAFFHLGFSISTDNDGGICDSHLIIAIKD